MKLAALAPALFVLVSMCGSPVPPPPGTITGLVFYDANHNAILDTCDDKMSAAPVLVTAADGKTTRVDADIDGSFQVDGVGPGDVTVSLDGGPTGWTWPITNEPDGTAGLPAHVESNKETVGLEIGVATRAALPTDSVSVLGIVFVDTNENGVIDRNECGKRTPANLNGDAQYVSVGDRPFTRLNVNGTFELRNLGVGQSEDTLAVRYVYGQSPLTELDVPSDHPCFIHASPRPRYATNIYEADIAFTTSSRYGDVSGVLFDDKNRNGTRDADEAGIPHQVVFLNPQGITCGNPSLNGTNDTTDKSGAFTIKRVPLGTYSVQISNSKPDDQFPTTLTIPDWPPEMRVTVRSDKPNTVDLPTRVEQTSIMNVLAFDDANDNGVQESGEDPVFGYWICAVRSPPDTTDNTGYYSYDQACGRTDHSGMALLRPLIAGDYQVPAPQFYPNPSGVPLRQQPLAQYLTLGEGDTATFSLPLLVVPASEQVLAPGVGTAVEFQNCFADPEWASPPFEEAYADAFTQYGGPPEDEAHAIYNAHIYTAEDNSLSILSSLAGQPDWTRFLPGCFDPQTYNGQLFVFANYEPLSVVTRVPLDGTQGSRSLDSVLQIVLRPRDSGLYAIILPNVEPSSPLPAWQLFVDENYNPIDRRISQGGWLYPGGRS